MVFSSLNFLFIFLPPVLLLHLLLPRCLKNIWLLLVSLLFYAWGEPVYVLLMLLSISYNYVAGRQIGERKKGKKIVLVSTLLVNLAILFFFKYYGFCVDAVNRLFHLSLTAQKLALPIGISFYTFQALSYIWDVYREDTPPQTNFIDFATYITMFPQLVAGPIVKYSDIALQLRTRRITLTSFGAGAERLIQGLCKKVLLANNLGLLVDTIQAFGCPSVLTSWLGIAAYTLQIYFDFSGYSDMAIGLGKMLGFSFSENFDYPYISSSITEFWRRWHISLSSWFRDYVYIPLGGNRVSKGRHILNLMLVWMLTGLWHGASWNFVLWGLYYGALLILEKYVLGNVLKRLPKVFMHFYTLLFVMIGWVIFQNTDFSLLFVKLGNLFGIGTCGLIDEAFLYFLRSNFILLALGILCAMPVMRSLMRRQMARHPVLAAVNSTTLLLLSIAYLVYGSYNPFLYFRF